MSGEAQVESIRECGDYVRELIGRDKARTDKIAEMRLLVDDGTGSGVASRLADELFAAAIVRAEIGREIYAINPFPTFL